MSAQAWPIPLTFIKRAIERPMVGEPTGGVGADGPNGRGTSEGLAEEWAMAGRVLGWGWGCSLPVY